MDSFLGAGPLSESTLLFFLLHVGSVFGIFLFSIRLVKWWLWPVINQLDQSQGASSGLFIASIAWLIGLSIRAVVGLYVFIGGLKPEIAIVITSVVAVVGLWSFQRSNDIDMRLWRKARKKLTAEDIFFVPILLILLCFGIMIFVPSDHWDSSVKYVTNAKYFANGWNAQNLQDASLLGSVDKILEIADAQSILGIGDTQFVLFLRWMNIVAMTMVVYSFMRLVNVSARWAALTTAGVLLSPELTRLGVSGKLDGTIAAIEIGAAASLMLAWYVRFELKSGNHYLTLVLLAFVLSLFAAAGRLSGTYIVSITGLSLLFLVLSANVSLRNKYLILGVSCILFGIFSGLYLFRISAEFSLLQSFGMLLLDDHGQAFEMLQRYYSIQQFPVVLNEIYLVVHLALGLENLTKKFQWLGFLPHARHHGISMFMLSPLMLSIFLAPLFIRRHRIIAIAAILFLFWFIIWASVAHFSRVFIAGSSVAVIIAGVIASLDREEVTKGQYVVIKVTRICLIGTVLVFLPWAIYSTAFRSYEYEIPRSLYDKELRHEIRLRFLEKQGASMGSASEASLLTYSEARVVDGVLAGIKLPIVMPDRSKVINMLFQNGMFVGDGVENFDDIHPGTDCLLGDKNYVLFRDGEVQRRFLRKIPIGEDWILYCLSDDI
jgi:hypothetical protein